MTVPLREVLTPTREGVAALSPEQRTVWGQVRGDVDAASAGSEFDIRRVLTLEGGALTAWTAARHEWVAGLLDGDPRVEHDA